MNQGHAKARVKFFGDVYDAIKLHINFEVVKAVLIGRYRTEDIAMIKRQSNRYHSSPGFLRDDFLKFVNETAVQRSDTVLIKNKSKFVKVHSSGGFKRCIAELLADDSVKAMLSDVKAADEVVALQRFYIMLAADQDRACYGYAEVLQADAQLAVEELLVTDRLFKSADVSERRMYVRLVESVREHGGRVFVFSSLHVSGEQLQLYTGVAATLRFPLPPELPADDYVSSDESDIVPATLESFGFFEDS